MDTDEQPLALSTAIGGRLRAFREAKGLRQDDVAEVARNLGLTWGRSSVASLESGNRNLSVEELAILPLLVSKMGGWEESMIPRYIDIKVGENFSIPSLVMRDLLSSLWDARVASSSLSQSDDIMELGEFSADEISDDEREREITQGVRLYDMIGLRVWPHVTHFAASPDAASELVGKVRDRLTRKDKRKVDRSLVTLIAAALWGHGLMAERDRRAAQRGPFDSARALQSARGHVTRELIGEIQQELDSKLDMIALCEDEVAAALESDAGHQEWLKRLHALERVRDERQFTQVKHRSKKPDRR